MNKYTWIVPGYSVRRIDGKLILNIIGSPDWEYFETWIAQGGVPTGTSRTNTRVDYGKMPKEVKAMLLTLANITGQPVATIKTEFKKIMRAI